MQSYTPHPPAISIIVPVYNVQDYLVAALNSIIKQTFSQPFEVLLVDDCSTDNSRSLCEDCVRSYPEQIRLLCHTENQGISVARNTGLNAVTGKYFTFVDPDDLLPSNALQTLYDAAISHRADIVKGNHFVFDETGYRPAASNVKRTKIYENEAILAAFFAHKEVTGFTWGKLFLSSAFAQIPNTPGVKMKQDTLYCAEIFAQANKLVLINSNIYHYRLRDTGVTGQKFRTGNYLWWLHSIEHAGHFARTADQKARHKELQIDILLQLAREARRLDSAQLATVLKEITHRQSIWQIARVTHLLQFQPGARALVKFLALRLALIQLQKQLTKPIAING